MAVKYRTLASCNALTSVHCPAESPTQPAENCLLQNVGHLPASQLKSRLELKASDNGDWSPPIEQQTIEQSLSAER
jgi:hypothetical protein